MDLMVMFSGRGRDLRCPNLAANSLSFTGCISLLLFASTPAASTSPPAWQTVYPDTKIVVPLFGEGGPRWQLDYQDTVAPSAPFQKTIPPNLTARVPGDVVSDLMHNGIVQDPYWDGSLWEDQEQWLGPQRAPPEPFSSCQLEQTRIWTYTTQIELDCTPQQQHSWQLVVESLQMGATIHWNGLFLGNITDQFLRYSFFLTHEHLTRGNRIPHLNKTQHNLTVSFDPSIETDGRFMACSGGWDWAPYTQACDAHGRRFLSRGIVQPIYLVAVDQFAVMHVVPKVYYQGEHLSSKSSGLHSTHPDADFQVNLDVHLQFAPGSSQSYSFVANADFTSQEQTKVVVPPSNGETSSVITFTMRAPRDQIELWWPNRFGAQPLYNARLGIRKQEKRTGSVGVSSQRLLAMDDEWITRRIGFRTADVITVNETEASIDDDDNDGTGMHGMYLRINGALVMARGANIIPADQLEGRYSYSSHTVDQSYQTIVQSAAAAHMNMIRVWGGGKVLPQAFYDACDELGILLYHDQMFVDEQRHGPSKTPAIQREIQHFVRSLASHPSIVIWNGCNECQVVMGTSNEIYATFVMQTVADEDNTRSIWPSSPSKYGWKTGVNRYDSKPNGQPLATRSPKDHKSDPLLETHGPYQRAFSKTYPGVNGVDQHFPFNSKPRKLYQGSIGPHHPNVFASEFGCSVWSSFESVSATVRPEHWALHGGSHPDQCKHNGGDENVCQGSNVMAQRNYPCDTIISSYFGNHTSLDEVGEKAFQAQLYQCMMGQTLWMKGDIEVRRSTNSFGLLIWQLNENWPTGGWGLLEYSAKMPGQLLGGRWKPLMHLMKDSLFTDVVAACGSGRQCYVRNDGIDAVNATVTLEAWNIGGSRNRCSVETHTFEATLPGGVSSTERFQYPVEWTPSEFDTILIRVADTQSSSTLMSDSPFLWGFPKSIQNLMSTEVKISIKTSQAATDAATISLASDALALYVVLTTQAPGRFTENAFVLRAHEPKLVSFVPLIKGDVVDVELLEKSIRVEHLGHYYQ